MRTIYSYGPGYPALVIPELNVAAIVVRQALEIAALVALVSAMAVVHIASVVRPFFDLGAILLAIRAIRKSPWDYLTLPLWALLAARRTRSPPAIAPATTARGELSTLPFTNLVGLQGLIFWLPAAYAIGGPQAMAVDPYYVPRGMRYPLVQTPPVPTPPALTPSSPGVRGS